MMLYKIMLVLIVFGAVNGMLNTVGLYSQKLPTTGNTGITEAQVTDLTRAAGKTPINPWTSYTVLSTVFGVIASVALSLVTIIPMLTAYGIPLPLAVAIQTPIWLVLAWGVYEMWTGHSSPSQD